MRIVILIALIHQLSWAQLPVEWNWRNPTPTGASLNSVAFAGGRFVVRGPLGALLQSPDGLAWTTLPDLPAQQIALGPNSAVAIDIATQTLRFSTDLRNWRDVALSENNFVTQVLYGDGKFLAITSEGVRFESSEGVQWQELTPLPYLPQPRPSAPFNEGVRANGVTLLGSEHQAIALDSGGNPHTIPNLYSFAFSEGTFIGIRQGMIYSSPDGIEWSLAFQPATDFIARVVAHKGRFFAYGSENIWSSTDATSWTPVANSPPLWPDSIASGNGILIAASGSATLDGHHVPRYLKVSTNGIDWVDIVHDVLPSARPDAPPFAFSQDAESFYLLDGFAILRTRDLSSWETAVPSETIAAIDSTSFPRSFARIPGAFLVVTAAGELHQVPDSGAPNQIASPADFITDLAFGNGTIAIVANTSESPRIYTTADLVNWSATEGISSRTVAFHDGLFLAFQAIPSPTGWGSRIAHVWISPDARSWADLGDFGGVDGIPILHWNGRIALAEYPQKSSAPYPFLSLKAIPPIPESFVNLPFAPRRAAVWQGSMVIAGDNRSLIQSAPFIQLHLARATKTLHAFGASGNTPLRVEMKTGLSSSSWSLWTNTIAERLSALPLPSGPSLFFRATVERLQPINQKN